MGLIFDKKLTWASHILSVKGRCMRDLNLLKVLTSTSWGADRQVMFQLYKTLVLPKLMYGSPVYGSAAPCHLKKLDAVHHAAIRICTGAFRTSPVESLYCESGLRSLWDQIVLEDLKFLSRLKRVPDSLTYRILTELRHAVPKMSSGLSQSFGLRVDEEMTRMGVGNIQVTPVCSPLLPPWRTVKVKCCLGPSVPKKANLMSLSADFRNHIEEHHSTGEHIYTDGSKTEAGVGYAAVLGDAPIMGTLPKMASIFTAELKAIYRAVLTSNLRPTRR